MFHDDIFAEQPAPVPFTVDEISLTDEQVEAVRQAFEAAMETYQAVVREKIFTALGGTLRLLIDKHR